MHAVAKLILEVDFWFNFGIMVALLESSSGNDKRL